MLNLHKGSIIGLAAALAFASYATAQTANPRPQAGEGSTSIAAALANTGTGGPAPKRELTGFWGGNVAAKLNEIPPMTPWGQQVFSTHKNGSEYLVAESNDPDKTCDPLGFPRAMIFMTRGIAFAQMSDRVLQLFQYDKTWREIFTDGRPLPTNVGANTKDAPDPRYWGYSVGHWEGDYTFVVETVGSDERSWLDNIGHPHSIGLHVVERYTRVDHNDLQVSITIDEPTAYPKPFVITTANFKWIPKQDFEEQICVPSEEEDYLRIIADPAAGRTPAK